MPRLNGGDWPPRLESHRHARLPRAMSWWLSLLQKCLQKVMQFFVHLGAVIHCLAYFIFDDFTKAAAEPVNSHLDRAFVQVELAGGIGLRNVFVVAGQPGFERFELVGLPDGLVF